LNERTFLNEDTSDHGSTDGSECPHRIEKAEPFPSLPQRHKIRDDDVCQGIDAPRADTLDGAANEEKGESIRRSRYHSPSREEPDCDHELTTHQLSVS
jgi:hypothetical protein